MSFIKENNQNTKFNSATNIIRTSLLLITLLLLVVLSFFIFSPRQWINENRILIITTRENSEEDARIHDDDAHSSSLLDLNSFENENNNNNNNNNNNTITSFIEQFVRDNSLAGSEEFFSDETQFPGFYERLLNSSSSSSSSGIDTCRFKRQHYWNFREQSCLPIPGLISAKSENSLSSSNQELQCLDKKNKKLPKNNNMNIEEWKPIGYWKDKKIISISEEPMMMRMNSSKSEDVIINSIYHNFQFATSWMFREWKYWKPHPKKVTEESNIFESNNNFIKGSHQPSLENLFVLENFCIEPFSGVSGYFSPNQSVLEGDPSNPLFPYKGKDDTRNFFHNEKTFMSFFHSQRIEKLPSPPKFFDERLVVFLRVAPLSRFHIYHTLNKFLATLGILRKLKEIINSRSSIAPLLIIVNEPMDDRYDSSRTPSLGYFYQLLSEFPWASVSVPRHITEIVGAKMDVMNYISHHQYHEKLFNLTRHNYSGDFFRRATQTNREEFRVCFRKAVLYQNCYDCSHSHSSGTNGIDATMHHDFETESYSFGIWQVADAPRISLVNQYRRLVDSCLAPYFPSKTKNIDGYGNGLQYYHLPTVFFALRTRSRRIIRDFPLMVDVIQSSLKSHFVNEILFREPLNVAVSKSNVENRNTDNDYNGFSEISYINDVRRKADIFVGMHGGDFAMTSLMPKTKSSNKNNEGGVVIEYSFDDAGCHYVKSVNQNVEQEQENMKMMRKRNGMMNSTALIPKMINPERCWFGVFSDAIKADHWIFLLGPYSGSRKQIVVSPNLFIDSIKEGACRWLFKKYGNNEEIREKIKKFNSTSSNKMPVEDESKRLGVVIRAMWTCLKMTKVKERSVVDISWNKRLRVERVLESVITTAPTISNDLISLQTIDPRFLRFLWFVFTPSNIDVPPKKIADFVSSFTSKINERIVKDKISSSFKLPILNCNNSSSVQIWNRILARLLLKDEGDKIYENSNQEIKAEKRDERFFVKEMLSINKDKIGCLPFGKDGEESCLYF